MESFCHVTCSIEKLGATAVITMIILTSDVTSAGFFFQSIRCQKLCSVPSEEKTKDPTSPISQNST